MRGGGGGGGPWRLIAILACLQEMFGGRERGEKLNSEPMRQANERAGRDLKWGRGILVSRFTEEEIIHLFAFRTTVTLSNDYLLHRDGRVFGIRSPTLCLSSCTAETPLSLASTLRSPIQPANQLRPSTHEDDCARRHLPRDRTIPLLHLLYILSRFLT